MSPAFGGVRSSRISWPPGLGLRVLGLGFRVLGLGFRVGFRAYRATGVTEPLKPIESPTKPTYETL